MSAMPDCDVTVIGAGAAGIAAGRTLQAAGVSVRILEAQARLGGRAWTRAVEGLPLDLGCGWLHSAVENEWTRLAETHGFTVDKTEPPWRRGGANLGFADGEHADFRAALEAFYARMDALGLDAPDVPASTQLDPSCRWNNVIDAVSTWANGAETDQVSIRDWNRYHDTEINWRVREGYGALVAEHGANLLVQFSCPVTRIDHSGPQLRIETTDGTLTARAVIVTVPTNVIAAEALQFVPALPETVEAAAALPLGDDDKLFISVENAGELPSEERLFGATDRVRTGSYHFRPFGRPVIECYFGGMLARELEQDGEAAFFDFASAQLADYFGSAFKQRIKPIVVSGWSRDPFARGSYSHALPGKADMRAVLARPIDDRLFFAGEACSLRDFSTAHGAYRTGVAAAEAAVRALA